MLVYLRDGSAQTIFMCCHIEIEPVNAPKTKLQSFVGWLLNVPATC